MNKEKLWLLSEVSDLEQIIATMHPDRKLDRMGLESRLQELKDELVKLPKGLPVRRGVITFRGTPVDRSHGVDSAFAGGGASRLGDICAMLAAGKTLSESGPIPDRTNNRLLITGTARGSFGFEFEYTESVQTELLKENDPLPTSDALTKLTDIIRATTQADDDQLAEVLEDVPARTVGKVRDFLDFLEKSEAWMRLECEDGVKFQYENLNQVKASVSRLSRNNVHESEVVYEGVVQGILPESRNYEFKPNSSVLPLLKGKLSTAILDPFAFSKEYLNQPNHFKFTIVRVGQARPRHVLEGIRSIKK